MRVKVLNQLSARKVDTIKTPGRHADGGGLYLIVTKAGTKSWLFRYHYGGKRREKGLGSIGTVTLSAARDKAAMLRTLIDEGKDPMEHRDIPADNPSFGTMATALIAELEPGWKNDKHKWQWRQTLETYCAPIWNRPVATITTTDIVDIIRPMWTEKRETAMRLRGRIEKVLDAAKVKGHRTGDNPARWRGHIELVMPKKKRGEASVRHHPAMPADQVPDFVPGLRSRVSTAARALEFLILTAARTTEVLKMTWGEVDMEARLWTVPAERMKMGKEHVVPLSEPALAVLRAMAMFGTKPEAPVFPNRDGEPLSGMAMEMTLRRMECDEFTVHGFRSTFRDWAGDRTDFPRDIIEMALAHEVGSEVERAYRRGTALAKRHELMEAWAAFVTGA
jgi:integrase